MSVAVQITLGLARGAAAQQRALDAWRAQQGDGADAALGAIVEGGLWPLQAGPVQVHRLAPGCFCCAGFLPMQVNLIRMLRALRPQAVLLLINDGAHLEALANRLRQAALGVELQIHIDAPIPQDGQFSRPT